MPSPEELAREKIDKLLTECGWIIQDRSTINLSAGRGIAVREALLKDRDEVDYLLFVDGKAIGTVEAKPEGYTLTGVEEQSGKYGKGLLDIYPKWREPLPFAYESTGIETQFTNQLDPSPKSRNVFAFHKPETLLEWVQSDTQLNTRLANLLTSDQMPKSNLWSAQIEAIRNLERSLAANKRRDLHPNLRADFVLANPPFNDSDWFRKVDDPRWQYGVAPRGNANFAWVQHFIHHLV
jgi:type I restriction enzyme R subunit